ncbi:hypothetical protein GF380_02410 [Candidatus Uhrbacteria bacterium]|nr:hypothetical protein [Candidatus Uhrbacteria bacterium]
MDSKDVFAVDVGFRAVKALVPHRVLIPSLVGTPTRGEGFSLRSNGIYISVGGDEFVPVGVTAMKESRHKSAPRTPDWALGNTWATLFSAALSEGIGTPYRKIQVVTGLPVSDWAAYAKPLHELYNGKPLKFTRRGRREQVVEIEKFSVVTQPFGTLALFALDDRGNVLDNTYATGVTAVCDIGGNTINFLVCDRLSQVDQYTRSDELGLLGALDDMRVALRAQYPRILPDTHEVAEWVAQGGFIYEGQCVDLRPYVDEYLAPIVGVVEDAIDAVWRESGRFDACIFTGGGAQCLKELLKMTFAKRFSIVNFGTQWSNVLGYGKLGMRLG